MNLKKEHIGQIESEALAARIYDKRVIIGNGLKAKTNFNYSKRQLERLLSDDSETTQTEKDFAAITGKM